MFVEANQRSSTPSSKLQGSGCPEQWRELNRLDHILRKRFSFYIPINTLEV
jgi:hypothetical protein